MADKKIVKLADIVNARRKVDINEEEYFEVRALTLAEMVRLFVESTDIFLPLYAAGIDGKFSTEALAPFLLTSPQLVAQIIALASDEPESAAAVEKNVPATVQLVALAEIWKASVPDPKKARELLSEVTALLQNAYEKANEVAKGVRPIPSQTTSPAA